MTATTWSVTNLSGERTTGRVLEPLVGCADCLSDEKRQGHDCWEAFDMGNRGTAPCWAHVYEGGGSSNSDREHIEFHQTCPHDQPFQVKWSLEVTS